jgi:hypothetical protein
MIDYEVEYFYYNILFIILILFQDNLWTNYTHVCLNFYNKLICFDQNIKSNKGNAKRGISPRLKIWPGDLDRWPRKSIGFQILLRTKYVPSLVKIHWRMLIIECSQGCYGRTNSSVSISLRNFVGEGIKKSCMWSITKVNTYFHCNALLSLIFLLKL